jgi:hypothetical protein
MTNPKDKLFKTILYDTPNGSRLFIRISEAEIERVASRYFDRYIVYDILEEKEKTLSYIVAYTVINHGIYLD